MYIKKIIYLAFGIGALIGLTYTTYHVAFKKEQKLWFTTEKPTKRTIQVIRSTGYLEAEDTLKIGSIVPGVIKKMLVEENENVKKGTLIAIIDDGKGDTEVRGSGRALKASQSNLIIQKIL